eukprot:Clim_evm47s227 gene=Clim_evmTU47s227
MADSEAGLIPTPERPRLPKKPPKRSSGSNDDVLSNFISRLKRRISSLWVPQLAPASSKSGPSSGADRKKPGSRTRRSSIRATTSGAEDRKPGPFKRGLNLLLAFTVHWTTFALLLLGSTTLGLMGFNQIGITVAFVAGALVGLVFVLPVAWKSRDPEFYYRRIVAENSKTCALCMSENCGHLKILDDSNPRERQKQIEKLEEPLMVSPAADTAISGMLELILEQFVHSWYDQMEGYTTFPLELRHGMKDIATRLCKRLDQVDLPSLIVGRLIPMLTVHGVYFSRELVHHQRNTRAGYGASTAIRVNVGGNRERLFHRHDIQSALEGLRDGLHMGLRADWPPKQSLPPGLLSDESYDGHDLALRTYLRTSVDAFLWRLLDQRFLSSRAVRELVREILSMSVIRPALESLAQPRNLLRLVHMLFKRIHERQISKMGDDTDSSKSYDVQQTAGGAMTAEASKTQTLRFKPTEAALDVHNRDSSPSDRSPSPTRQQLPRIAETSPAGPTQAGDRLDAYFASTGLSQTETLSGPAKSVSFRRQTSIKDIYYELYPNREDPASRRVELLVRFASHRQHVPSSLSMTLPGILTSSIALYHFMKYLDDLSALDLLSYCMGVEEYTDLYRTNRADHYQHETSFGSLNASSPPRSTIPSSRLGVTVETLQTLYMNFLSPENHNRVGLPDSQLRPLRGLLQSIPYSQVEILADLPDPGAFRPSYEHCYTRLQNEWCPLFLKSEYFFRLLCLGHRLGGSEEPLLRRKGPAHRSRITPSRAAVSQRSRRAGKEPKETAAKLLVGPRRPTTAGRPMSRKVRHGKGHEKKGGSVTNLDRDLGALGDNDEIVKPAALGRGRTVSAGTAEAKAQSENLFASTDYYSATTEPATAPAVPEHVSTNGDVLNAGQPPVESAAGEDKALSGTGTGTVAAGTESLSDSGNSKSLMRNQNALTLSGPLRDRLALNVPDEYIGGMGDEAQDGDMLGEESQAEPPEITDETALMDSPRRWRLRGQGSRRSGTGVGTNSGVVDDATQSSGFFSQYLPTSIMNLGGFGASPADKDKDNEAASDDSEQLGQHDYIISIPTLDVTRDESRHIFTIDVEVPVNEPAGSLLDYNTSDMASGTVDDRSMNEVASVGMGTGPELLVEEPTSGVPLSREMRQQSQISTASIPVPLWSVEARGRQQSQTSSHLALPPSALEEDTVDTRGAGVQSQYLDPRVSGAPNTISTKHRILREFADFRTLHLNLRTEFGDLGTELPSRHLYAGQRSSADAEQLRIGMEEYLLSLMDIEKVRHSVHMRSFLEDTGRRYGSRNGDNGERLPDWDQLANEPESIKSSPFIDREMLRRHGVERQSGGRLVSRGWSSDLPPPMTPLDEDDDRPPHQLQRRGQVHDDQGSIPPTPRSPILSSAGEKLIRRNTGLADDDTISMLSMGMAASSSAAHLMPVRIPRVTTVLDCIYLATKNLMPATFHRPLNQMLMKLGHLLMPRYLNTLLQESVEFGLEQAASDESISYLCGLLEEVIRDVGQPSSPIDGPTPPTPREMPADDPQEEMTLEEMREEIMYLIIELIPSFVSAVIVDNELEKAIADVLKVLSVEECNMQLLLGAYDVLVAALFPELELIGMEANSADQGSDEFNGLG